jgi:hypothetical protein
MLTNSPLEVKTLRPASWEKCNTFSRMQEGKADIEPNSTRQKLCLGGKPVARRGNPYAIVRLEPHVMELILQQSPPRERGRGGGVSQYLRRLVYSHLGLGEAPCFAEVVQELAPARCREPHAAPELA